MKSLNKEKKIKPVTNIELAKFLGISKEAVSNAMKNKTILMRYGLAYMKSVPELLVILNRYDKKGAREHKGKGYISYLKREGKL